MNSVSRPRLAQLHADGTLDAGFSLATGGFNNTVYALRLQTNGNVGTANLNCLA